MPRKKSTGAQDLQFEEIGNPFLPKDWKRVIVKRQRGKTKDLVDIYVIASDGKKLRSSVEFLKHLAKTKTPFRINPDNCIALFTKSNLKAENFANQNLLIKLVPSLANETQREEMGISLCIRKRGRPKRDSTVENTANLVSKSGNRPQEENLGTILKLKKTGRPKKNYPAENIANQNQLPTIIPTLESKPKEENLEKSIEPRKRGIPNSATAKRFVLINQESKLLSTLGKEPKIFKRRKRWGKPKSTDTSNTLVSSSNDEIEEISMDHHETRADKSVQTDDFLFTFRNESSNFQSYDCMTSRGNLPGIEKVPTKMVLTRFETGDVSVPKRFTYLPSSMSKMKWDSVSGTYVIDVDGKVIPSLICNDEDYSRLKDEDLGEHSLSISPDIKDMYDSDMNLEDFEDSKICDTDVSQSYFIDHSSVVTICHRPKTRNATWIPPKSPYNLIQQLLYDDPWKLLISTLFEECHDPKHFWEFTDKWPSAKELLRVNVRTLADFLQDCGIHRLRAGTFLKFTDDFLHTDWVDPINLFGIRNFGRECYILFYLGEWQTFKPKSGILKLYLKWYHENFVDE